MEREIHKRIRRRANGIDLSADVHVVVSVNAERPSAGARQDDETDDAPGRISQHSNPDEGKQS